MRKSRRYVDVRCRRNRVWGGIHLFIVALLVVSNGHAFSAQIVIVKASDAEPYSQAEEGIRARLAERHDTLRTVPLKDVSDKGVGPTIGQPDAVVAIGTPAARWMQKQLPANIKLVYCMVTNPDEAGLFAGRDSWGVTLDVALDAQIHVIAEALPRAKTIGLLYRSDTPDSKSVVEVMKRAVPPSWRVEAVAVSDHPSVAAAIDALTQKNTDIIWTMTDPKLYDTAAVHALLLAGLRTRTPVWGFSPAFVRAGALVGVGVESRAQGTQAADLLVRALEGHCGPQEKGQPPKDFQIAVNLIVATQIGVEIPDGLTKRAAFVYRPEK